MSRNLPSFFFSASVSRPAALPLLSKVPLVIPTCVGPSRPCTSRKGPWLHDHASGSHLDSPNQISASTRHPVPDGNAAGCRSMRAGTQALQGGLGLVRRCPELPAARPSTSPPPEYRCIRCNAARLRVDNHPLPLLQSLGIPLANLRTSELRGWDIQGDGLERGEGDQPGRPRVVLRIPFFLSQPASQPGLAVYSLPLATTSFQAQHAQSAREAL